MFKNRFLIVLGVLSLLLVAMAISFPLSNAPTSAERGRAAEGVRWTAVGEYYEKLNGFQSLARSRTADAARWTASGNYYMNLEVAQIQRSRAADTARWNATAEYYRLINLATP